jgi:hypothetical protein
MYRAPEEMFPQRVAHCTPRRAGCGRNEQCGGTVVALGVPRLFDSEGILQSLQLHYPCAHRYHLALLIDYT